jgi:hypothetical protein
MPSDVAPSALDLIRALLKQWECNCNLHALLSLENISDRPDVLVAKLARLARGVAGSSAALVWLLDKTTNRYSLTGAADDPTLVEARTLLSVEEVNLDHRIG